MKNAYKGAIAFGIVALLAVSFVAANGLGIGHQFGTLSDENKETMKANMDAIKTAIKNNDYDAWAAAMNKQIEAQIAIMQAQITETNFNELVANYNEKSDVQAKIKSAKEAGDTETLQQLQEQYGFGKGMKGNGQGKGMHGNCPMAENSSE